MEYRSIDSWTGEYDEDYCYDCQKFVEGDKDGNCPICTGVLEFTDDFASGDVAKTSISVAPSVSSTGDIWHRDGGSYTWGRNTSTWNTHQGSTLSGMWSTGSNYFSRDNNDAARMLKHKSHLDSLCKVVDPTVSHTLEFNHANTGYTNMKTGRIVIDGTLLKDNDDKLDVVAGLSIHEKLHLVHTQALTKWEREYQYSNDLDSNQVELLHSIANSVEDEYIEKQLSKDCAGFVKYIVATKNYYFNEKVKDVIDKPNDNPYLDLMNTLLALIRYPENINADRKKRHAKHIQFFARALANALDSREDVIKAIKTLYAYMNKVADKMAEKHGDSMKSEAGEKMKELRDKLGDDLTEDEWKGIEDKVEKDMRRKHGRDTSLEKLLSSLTDRDGFKNICGATDYKPDSKDKSSMLDDDLVESLKSMEDTDYHETTLGKSEVTDKSARKITWRTALSDGRAKDVYDLDSSRMKAQTNQLKKKIQLYGNRDKFVIRNQKSGRLDKRMLHRIPMDRRDIFHTTIVKEDKPLDVCLLVDESGSMGSLMTDARRSCISVKEALEDNAMLDLWVMGHTADGHDGWHQDPRSTNMTIYHSPSVKDRKHALGSMRARYENRDGNAILAGAQRVREESSNPMSNKLMIVFSDGSPAAIGYGGGSGIEHVAKVVKGLEAKGWSIIQVGFGGAHFQERMFSNHIYVDDMRNLSGKISKIIRKVIKV